MAGVLITEDFFKLLGLLLLGFFFLLIFRQFKNIIDLYRRLGANINPYIPLRASLTMGGKRFQIIFFKGFTIRTPSPVGGYLSAKRKLIGKGFNLIYDDQIWAYRVLNTSKIKPLTETAELPHLNSFEIVGNTLNLRLSARKINTDLEQEIRKALELLLEATKSLEGLPSSTLSLRKEQLRRWLLYYIPFGAFLLLSAFGFYWMVKGYSDPLCENDLFVLGLKVLTPIFLAHFLLAVFFLGRHLHLKAHLLPLVVIYFVGYYLAPLVILSPFNARLDMSQPKKVETKILKKYKAYRGGFRLVLEHTGCSFRVSEKLYKKAKVGDELVLYIRDGAFGVKWAYRYWLKDKTNPL